MSPDTCKATGCTRTRRWPRAQGVLARYCVECTGDVLRSGRPRDLSVGSNATEGLTGLDRPATIEFEGSTLGPEREVCQCA
jgi:hypothetical protein